MLHSDEQNLPAWISSRFAGQQFTGSEDDAARIYNFSEAKKFKRQECRIWEEDRWNYLFDVIDKRIHNFLNAFIITSEER